MKTYRLKGSWALCGWLNDPFCVADLTGAHENPVRPLPYALFAALLKCDGQTALEEDRLISALLRHGIIEPGTEPLSPEQRYRVYSFERRQHVRISITGRCNYRCLHCLMAGDGNMPAAKSEFTPEQCGYILDELLKCGITNVELTGGEPLISPNFFHFAEGLTQRNMRLTRILTNGSLLTDDILSRLTALGHAPIITISFDGLTTHDWMRGVPGAGQQALDALRRARGYGLPLRCAINVNAHTLPELADTCRFLRDEGVETLFLIPTTQTPRWNENEWNEKTLSFNTYFMAMERLIQAAITEKWGMQIDVFTDIHLTENGELVTKEERFGRCAELSATAISCPRAAAGFFIAHDGRVLPCDAFEGISLAGGILQDDNNILTRPLKEILTSSSYTRLYRMPLSEIAGNNPACADCEYLHVCRGGCRAYAYGESMAFHEGYQQGNGRINGSAQISCTFYKGGFAKKLYALRKEL